MANTTPLGSVSTITVDNSVLQIRFDLQDMWLCVHYLICQSDQRLSALFRVCYLKNRTNEEQEICAGQTSVQEDIILSCNSVLRRKNEDVPGGTHDLTKDQNTTNLNVYISCLISFHEMNYLCTKCTLQKQCFINRVHHKNHKSSLPPREALQYIYDFDHKCPL